MRRPQFSPNALYSEGLLVGYRWFDAKELPVMYPFGYGLSYVDFNYSDMKTNKKKYGSKDIIKVSFNISNTGDMEADEVAQLYVSRVEATVEWPEKELKAFKRVTVGAGETESVTLDSVEDPLLGHRYRTMGTRKRKDRTASGQIVTGNSIEIICGNLKRKSFYKQIRKVFRHDISRRISND